MDEIKLDVELRKQIGTRKIKSVRRAEFIPAIVYGGKKKTPTAIKVNRPEYERIMRYHVGQSVVFHLNVMDEGKKLRDYSAIVKEEQLHPLRDDILHLDFQRISLTEEIEVSVQIEVKGEAIGVKRDGGALDHQLWEIDVKCLPTNIPEHLEVDVSELEIGDSIHVKDLKFPQGVKTDHDEDSVIVAVAPPMKEEEATDEETPEEPEVIGEKEKQEKAEEKKEEAAKEDSAEKKEG